MHLNSNKILRIEDSLKEKKAVSGGDSQIVVEVKERNGGGAWQVAPTSISVGDTEDETNHDDFYTTISSS